jgi:hypothetical protein
MLVPTRETPISNEPVSCSSATPSKAKSASISDAGAKVRREGDYEAARRYDKNVKHIVETADIEQATYDEPAKQIRRSGVRDFGPTQAPSWPLRLVAASSWLR